MGEVDVSRGSEMVGGLLPSKKLSISIFVVDDMKKMCNLIEKKKIL